MCGTVEIKAVKYSNEIKKEVVNNIMEGRLLIDEAMATYGVLSRATIKKWLREALDEAQIASSGD